MTIESSEAPTDPELLAHIDALFDQLAEHDDSQQLAR